MNDYLAELEGRRAAEAAYLAAQNRIAELEAELAAERAKTSRLQRQIRNRELEDTGLYDWNGEPLK